jgi:ubiquinone/menaquinone biosynthesis C-methylase UbiE
MSIINVFKTPPQIGSFIKNIDRSVTLSELIRQPLEDVGGVNVFSRAENATLYDKLWSMSSADVAAGLEVWGRKRVHRLTELLCGSPYDVQRARETLNDKVVLDMCCGQGRMSAACLELGAAAVVGCDGSYEGPKSALQMITTMDHKLAEKFFPVVSDVADVGEAFKPDSFDVALFYFAVMHVRDPMLALKSLQIVLRPGGLAFMNFFLPSAIEENNNVLCGESSRKLRAIFINQSLEVVCAFLGDVGTFKGTKEKFTLQEFCDGSGDQQYDVFREDVKRIVNELGIEAVRKLLHLENLQTPHLNCYDVDIVKGWFNSLGMTVLDVAAGDGTHAQIVVRK